jgi:hypothetical protein
MPFMLVPPEHTEPVQPVTEQAGNSWRPVDRGAGTGRGCFYALWVGRGFLGLTK